MTKARTVCCRTLVDVETAPKAKAQNMELLVCNDTCKGFIEKASPEQLQELLK
ncbi:MAG TPA: hypothetical protein VJM69_00235 [Dehalococcoidia bacterium]|nr:hypothetical protein [Dehalococcoidia bacterium]